MAEPVNPFFAAEEGDEAAISRWLASGDAKVDAGDSHGFTPLHWAVRRGHLAVVGTLLRAKASANKRNDAGDTPLHYAVTENHPLIEKLLAAGAEVDATNAHGNTPLHYACFYRREEPAALLISKGALIARANKYGESPLDKLSGDIKQRLADLAKSKGQSLTKIPFTSATVAPSAARPSLEGVGSAIEFTISTAPTTFVVDATAIKIEAPVGAGSLGGVSRGVYAGRPVVFKLLHRQEWTAPELKELASEVEQLRITTHPNILPVLCVSLRPPNVGLVSPLAPRGSLSAVLADKSVQINSTREVAFALGIAKAMDFMTTLPPPAPTVQLKSSSLMIGEDFAIRLSMADSGLNRIYAEASQVFTPHWSAPEVLRSGLLAVKKESADVYSFGVILNEIVTRTPPYQGMNAMQIGMKVVLEDLRPTIPGNVAPHYAKLIEVCWNTDPSKRPLFKQIIPILEKL